MSETKEERAAEKDQRVDWIVKELCRHSIYGERSGLAENLRKTLNTLSQVKVGEFWTLICLGRKVSK